MGDIYPYKTLKSFVCEFSNTGRLGDF